MIKRKARRRCRDCGKDISNRFVRAVRCLDCAYERSKRMDRRRNRARRRTEREAK